MKFLGNAIQLFGLVAVSLGVGLELGLGGSLFLILISAGAVIFAVGTKLKHG